MKLEETVIRKDWENAKETSHVEASASDAALGALLEDEEGGEGGEGGERDAERRVQQLGGLVARLDALNVAGMLAAATEGEGAALAARLDAGLVAGAALASRLRRCEQPARSAPDAAHARSGAARADANARALLAELEAIREWLEPPPLQELDALHELALGAPEGRERALAAAVALRSALRAERTAPPARLRLAAVRDRLQRLARARDQLAAALARHLNNVLIHLGNEAAAAAAGAGAEARSHRHHAELLPYAPFMRWLKDMDEKAFDALVKVYAGTWSRVYEREVRSACEAARAALSAAHAHAQPGVRARSLDDPLDNVLGLVESLCNAEQDFCTQFFFLDIDVKGESGETEAGDIGDKAEGGEGGRRATAESRRFMSELFPGLEAELVALVGHLERLEPYGAMRALACAGRRALGGGGGGGAEAEAGAEAARWARAALAGAAVAAKRGADRAVAERVAALGEAVKAAARKPKCGLFSFVTELEALSAACETLFAASGRRGELDRWYVSLASALMAAVQQAEHPRTPRAVVHMENYHRLHGALSAVRAPALERLRRECRARYGEALRAYVTQYFPRPLEKLAQFFEGVAEAVAGGVREDEVCYRAAFSKHELRRVLALYPAQEVRKSLHRLYRTVEKHLSEEGGLLQVVWRAMQEEFIAQHVALQGRIASCYGGSGLTLPLTTQDILDAFSDIAREH